MEQTLKRIPKNIYRILDKTLDRVLAKNLPSDLTREEATILLSATDSPSVSAIAAAADACRAAAPCKDTVSFVVNRNINFTNACVMRCGFCAFSRTGIDEQAYFLPLEEIVRRAVEAANLGATEICIQAGLPPNMDKDLYVTVARSVKAALPDIHLHAFSPEEIIYGAKRNKISILEMMTRLKEAGVNSFPGTSAEILDDTVRDRIAKGRLSSAQWKETVQAAHSLLLPTTATMMYGHIETVAHVADHLAQIRELQTRSKSAYNIGFTEFVPLSFVAKESPMWKLQNEKNLNTAQNHGNGSDLTVSEESADPSAPWIRSGPTGVEVVLTHAVSRMMLAGHIDNIQVSWPKEGYRMSQVLLGCGVNDLGGTLMNESISTAAGAAHGQFASPSLLRGLITSTGRTAMQRNTDYSVRRTFPEATEESLGRFAEEDSPLDSISDSLGLFGSFEKLTKSSENRYIDFHKKSRGGAEKGSILGTGRRSYCTSAKPQTSSRMFSSSSTASRTSTSTSTSTSSSSAASASSASISNGMFESSYLSPASDVESYSRHYNRNQNQNQIRNLNRKVTFSSSFTIVPTYECFNLCTYCNFRTNVRSDESKMMTMEAVAETLTRLREQNESRPLTAVHEILILSGEVHPKSLRRVRWLQRIIDICSMCLDRGFLPHTNVGPLSLEEMRLLGAVNASMGLMLEQSVTLEVHRLAPSKVPALRLAQLTQAGELKIPFTTGILLGIGESSSDRLDTIRNIAAVAEKYGNIQEVIIQPYSPGKKDKYGAQGAMGYPLSELPEFIAQVRSILPVDVLIQVPPNLVCANSVDGREGSDRGSQGGEDVCSSIAMSHGSDKGERLEDIIGAESSSARMESSNQLIGYRNQAGGQGRNDFLLSLLEAGACDLGGISPLDEVNPSYDFQRVDTLREQLKIGDFNLVQRLPVHERHFSLLSERVRRVVNDEYHDFYSKYA